MEYAIEVLEFDAKLIKRALVYGTWKGYDDKKRMLLKRLAEVNHAINTIKETKDQ